MTGSDSRKVLDPRLLEEVASEIGNIAQRQRTAVALVGGFALQYFGSSRLTGDVDVIASDALRELEPTRQLNFGGQKTTVATRTGTLVPVDVIVRDDDFADLYIAALDHVVDRGAPLPIVEPEYLAAMKMVAGRRKDDDDLAFMITSDVIDIDKAERIIRKHLGAYAMREFRSFVEETRWRASRSDD